MSFAVDQLESNLERWENRKHTTHDSGVSTLVGNDEQENQHDPTLPVTATKPKTMFDRENDTSTSPAPSPYNIQPTTVEFIHSRLSMEGTPNEMTSMPTMAMKHYTPPTKIDDQDDDLSTLSHFPASGGNPPPGWHDGPVYCQCTIQ